VEEIQLGGGRERAILSLSVFFFQPFPFFPPPLPGLGFFGFGWRGGGGEKRGGWGGGGGWGGRGGGGGEFFVGFFLFLFFWPLFKGQPCDVLST